MKFTFFFLLLIIKANHLLAGGDSLYYVENFDDRMFRSINNIESPILSSVVLATDRSSVVLSGLVPIALFTVSRINNNYYDENSAVLLGLSNVLTFGSSYAIKNIVKRERPFTRLKNIKEHGKDPFIDRYSFPSGHTSLAFSTATSLSLRYSDKPVLIAGLYTYALFIGFGRVHLGVHYPTDVLGGMIIGTGNALLVHGLRKEIINAKNNLFNEKDRQERNDKIDIPGIVLFGTFAGTEIINSLLQKSNNRLLNNSELNFTGESVGIKIHF